MGEPESKIHTIIRTLDHQNMPWCVLNDKEQLRHPKPCSDLDIWCAPAQPIRLLIELSLHGWTVQSGRCFGQPGAQNFACTLRLQSQDEAYPRLLDISFGNLRTGVFVYGSASAGFCEEAEHPAMRILRKDKALARLVTRAALRNTLSAAKWARGREIWQTLNEHQRDDWRHDTGNIVGQKARRLLENSLENPRREIDGFRIRLHAFAHTYLLQPRNLANFLGWAKSKCRDFGASKRSMILYLIGTDGAGKSTTAQTVIDYWRQQYPDNRAAYHYWGRGRANSPLVSLVRDIVLRAKRSRSKKRNSDGLAGQGAGDDQPDRDNRGHMSGTLGLLVYLVEYWFRRWRLMFAAEPATLHIIDRGPLDLKVMYDAHPWARNLWFLGPSADIVVLCQAADSVILNRKQERSAKVIGQHLQDYHSVLKFLRRGDRFAYTLDTDQGKTGSLNEILCVLHAIRCWKVGKLDARAVTWLLSQNRNGSA